MTPLRKSGNVEIHFYSRTLMSMTFTKLFSSITESTIWTESDPTRIMWITMLAMSDRHGRVWASIPGLANRARVSLSEAEAALNKFLSPDKYSRTSDYEGRRIEVIDGGWRLLNHEKYRAIRDHESVKESKRKYISNRRENERVENVDRSRHNAEADTESEADTKLTTLSSDARLVLSFLNEKTGRKYRDTDTNLRLIIQRLKSGATVQDCKTVIARKHREWASDDVMWKYLRPATLFNATKFEQYLGECVSDDPSKRKT